MARLAKRLLTVAFVVLLSATGCAGTRASIHADATITGRTVNHWSDGESEAYESWDDLTEYYLSQPLPQPQVITPPAPPLPAPPPSVNVNAFYGPLLTIIHGGPGGQQINLQHLKQITPALLQLVQVAQSLGVFQFPSVQAFIYSPLAQQLLLSPQFAQFYNLAQQILSPLGLWNTSSLSAWANYLLPLVNPQSATNLQSVLVTLYTNLLTAAGGPPAPPPPLPTPPPYSVPFNMFEALLELDKLWNSLDSDFNRDWLKIAELYPGLVHSMIKHLGWTKPQIVLYGGRGGNYKAGFHTQRRTNDGWEVQTLNEDGWLRHEPLSSAGRYWQGPNDVTLDYFPVEIKDRRVTTLDVIASDRHVWLKRATGGNVDLLDRVSAHSTALISLELAQEAVSARVVGGSTPYSVLGGGVLSLSYGVPGWYFSGRVSAGMIYEDSLFSDTDNILAYGDMENVFRTPTISAEGSGGVASAWLSLTTSFSGLASRATSRSKTHSGVSRRAKWGMQGDARLIPEINMQLATRYMDLQFAGGMTFAVVPHGRVYLYQPSRSMALRPIRAHFGATWRLHLSKIRSDIEQDRLTAIGLGSAEEWWTPEELEDHLASYRAESLAAVSLQIQAVGEFSKIYGKGRLSATLLAKDFEIGILGEVEDQYGVFTDIRLGGGVGFKGAYVRTVASVKDGDYRVEAGFDLVALHE